VSFVERCATLVRQLMCDIGVRIAGVGVRFVVHEGGVSGSMIGSVLPS
jgi:hypothetical protein